MKNIECFFWRCHGGHHGQQLGPGAFFDTKHAFFHGPVAWTTRWRVFCLNHTRGPDIFPLSRLQCSSEWLGHVSPLEEGLASGWGDEAEKRSWEEIPGKRWMMCLASKGFWRTDESCGTWRQVVQNPLSRIHSIFFFSGSKILLPELGFR